MEFPFKAVLFDMDGTITDTTRLHDAAWDEFARAHTGQGVNPGDPRLVPGRTIDVVRAILGRPVQGAEAKKLHDDKEQRFHTLARGKLTTLPGFARYRRWLRMRHIPVALVTNAPRINIDFTLYELQLEYDFDLILGAEDTERGKPHPDPFLEACKRLKVAPQDTLVHEDSALGIAAGVAAGCKVAAILTGISPAAARSAGAKWSTDNFEQWLAQIN
ncbi:HAD family hydrolase [Chitinimonas sp. BJB300]|uniref:HAD family hydrolase n=1 Tax=Chitinimonas sp. BJB300 TaxID=1559339 RepID=UPI0013040A35|nr:HAD family phosphatase [Chitinimonas sp. BJB300]